MDYHYVRQAQYKKGFIAPLLLALVALLILGGGAYVYVQKKQENTPAVNRTVQATSTVQTSSSQTVGWKVYRNKKYEFELKYPDGYTIGEDSYNEPAYELFSYGINFFTKEPANPRFSLYLERQDGNYCHLGLCDLPAVRTIKLNDIIWDDLGNQNYCDADACSQPGPVYRVVQARYRYYLYFKNEPQYQEVLKSFKFLKSL